MCAHVNVCSHMYWRICVDIYIQVWIHAHRFGVCLSLCYQPESSQEAWHYILWRGEKTYTKWKEICYLWASVWRACTYQSCLVWANRICMLVGNCLVLQWQHSTDPSSRMHMLTCLHMACKPTGLCLLSGILIQHPKLWAKHHAHTQTSKHNKHECGKKMFRT